jgi:hypothetical protein
MHHRSFLIWMTILLLVSGPQGAAAQAGTARVYADPPLLEIGEGQVGTIQILLADARNIYGIDLQATFDPGVVQVVDADSRQKGVQMAPGAFLNPDFTVYNTADNGTGRLRYVITQTNPSPSANGKGVVLSVQFRGKSSGATSKLVITFAAVADRRGNKQPVTLRGADLVIVLTKTSTPTPLFTPTPILPTLAQPTTSPVRIRTQPVVRPGPTAVQKKPAGETEVYPASPDRVLTYISMGAFSGAILFSGLSFWLLAAKHRKERDGKSK